MATMITFEQYRFDLDDLYQRMWSLGVDDAGDGTRLFRPRPGAREALKWLIEDLCGAVADPVRTMRANDALRRQAHDALVQTGRAERINQVSFRLLGPPASRPAGHGAATSESADLDEVAEGVAIVGVPVEEVSADGDTLLLVGLEWSPWHRLEEAARTATTSPGVYVARSGGQIVYVGMAGERRGLGVRGRLQAYGRGGAAISGLGEAAFDRALADPVWLAEQRAKLLTDGPSRARSWAAASLRRVQIELCWVAAPDASTARQWETRVLQALEDLALWNRARPGPRDSRR